jgi:hypothetical protein
MVIPILITVIPKHALGFKSFLLGSSLLLRLLILLLEDLAGLHQGLHCKEAKEEGEADLKDQVWHGRIHNNANEAAHHDCGEHDDG